MNTDMDYKKLYEEALERADEAVQKGCLDKATFNEIFPPEESEDERMLKKIIDYLEMIKMGCVICTIDTSEEIAWLKKQKELDKMIVVSPEVWDNAISDAFENGKKEGEKQKEQKPSTGIYWHAIKRGEKLPCRAYIWNPDYEKYHDCWEGRLIPNLEKICVGADTWYLPADDVKNLPREGLDELQKEQKPVEWSEEDEQMMEDICSHLIAYPDTRARWQTFLKSLRPQKKEDLAKMLQDEYEKGREYGERIGHTKGFNKGYKVAEEEYRNATAYKYPVPPSGIWCDGTHCTNPHHDCVNCPTRYSSSGTITTPNSATIVDLPKED